MPRALLMLLLLSSSASAAPDAASVHRMLEDDAGWTVYKLDARGGVDIYKKEIPGVAVPAFKGVKVVDVDPTALFDRIIDIPGQVGLSDAIPLRRSVILSQKGDTTEFWQYLDVPGWTLANDRYWFLRAVVQRDIGGVRGHDLQRWEGIDPGPWPKVLQEVKAIDEDAVMTGVNFGSWEVIPEGPGRTRLIYRVLSDPGGSLPKAAQALATGRTLPDNLLQFEAAAKAGR